MPSGTCTASPVCQPAPSSTSMFRFSGLAPISRAKAASIWPKRAAVTVGRSHHSVSPVEGRTKPQRTREPFIPLLDGGNRSLPDRCPDLPDQGEQPDPMLIGGPELDLGVR